MRRTRGNTAGFAAIAGLDGGQRRRELLWAWLSLLTLILCWDASERLEEYVSPPRVRIAHAGEQEDLSRL